MTRVQTLLLACLHQDPARLDIALRDGVDDELWRELIALATVQRVRPLVFRRLSAAGGAQIVPSATWAALERDCQRVALRNLRLHAELTALVKDLGTAGIPVIALKGAHVATALYGNVALREIGDLDLLVQRTDLARAASIVIGRGYAPLRRFNIDVDVAVSQHVTRLLKPPAFSVEMHWNITEPRQPYTIDPAALWTHAVPFRIGSADALALGPEDLLLHLCLHTAYQHRFEFGLRSLCDIRALLDRQGDAVDWRVVRQRAGESNWMAGARLTLEVACDLLGAIIPRAELDAFGPSPGDSPLRAAGAQLLTGHDPGNTLGRGLSMIDDHQSAIRKTRHVVSRLFLEKADLTREYPWAPVAWWGWWMVYIARGKDLLARHIGLIVRRWIGRDTALLARADRQRQVRQWLLGAGVNSR